MCILTSGNLPISLVGVDVWEQSVDFDINFEHCRLVQHFFILPLPPYLGLSRQKRHFLQSSPTHPSHTPHLFGFFPEVRKPFLSMQVTLVKKKLLSTCCIDEVSFQGGHVTECVSGSSTTKHRTTVGLLISWCGWSTMRRITVIIE